jgi:hypothetical protein
VGCGPGIKGFFEAIDHDLLSLALDEHVNERWLTVAFANGLGGPPYLHQSETLSMMVQ